MVVPICEYESAEAKEEIHGQRGLGSETKAKKLAGMQENYRQRSYPSKLIQKDEAVLRLACAATKALGVGRSGIRSPRECRIAQRVGGGQEPFFPRSVIKALHLFYSSLKAHAT
ncbi:hypothetical protein FHX14_002884 [Rhizobium sp. BK619]|nr:hypothetical protein [Rhizobium sp. BK619]